MRYFPLLITLNMTLLPFTTVTADSINLPQTGQTQCHSESGAVRSCTNSGEDGEYQAGVSLPNPRFTADASGQCITDNLTGLMWTKDASLAGDVNWAEALAYANNLVLCGHDDWRMPNRKELFSLMTHVTADHVYDWLISESFINVDHFYNWTSTTDPDTGSAWYISYFDGRVELMGKDYATGSIWPVRGGH